ncbi:phosphotransferase [Microlunatus elymi]|uniref:Phosphotransferase n=1 Tax=Microlunatus elymi TaxID=2596828 RepID=A0A516PXP7_9ACTN|nr:phosphotransferase [Microlunatus elymi]QDP95948.1 phosphotransferase [Microlunatus elymi]
MIDDPYERCTPSDELVAEIADHYRLGEVRGSADLGGSWTTNIKIDTADRVVVARIHRHWTSASRLHALQVARSAVHAGGVPTVLPIRDQRGNTFNRLGKDRLVELEPYVDWDTRMNTPELFRIGFPVLGRVHDVLRTTPVPQAAESVRYANHVHSWRAAELTQLGADRMHWWQDDELHRFADDVVRHIDQVTAREAELADDQLRQLAHGDFWDNNVLFAGDRLAAVIDFDFMASRWRIDDLALTIYFWLLEPGRGLPDEHDQQQARTFVDAYDSGTELPLSRAERLALPLAIARQPAWSVGRWVLGLDDDQARSHARSSAREFPVAAKVLADLDDWQRALTEK